MSNEKSKKTEQENKKDLNKDEGNLFEPVDEIIDFGTLPEEEDKKDA